MHWKGEEKSMSKNTFAMLKHFENIGAEDISVSKNALLKICNDLQSMKDKAEDDLVLERMVKLLESQNVLVKKRTYCALVTLLSLKRFGITGYKVKTLIEKHLVTVGTHTKKERRLIASARIVADGAIIRSKTLDAKEDEELINFLIQDLVALSSRKFTLLELATPFICALLDSFTSKKIRKLNTEPLISMLTSSQEVNLPLLQIAVSLKSKNIDVDILRNIDGVIKSMIELPCEQIETHQDVVNSFIQYISDTDSFMEFWDVLSEHLKSTHVGILTLSLKKSIALQCPLRAVMRPVIVKTLLKHCQSKNPDVRNAIRASFQLLLDWNGQEIEKKERKKWLNMLFSNPDSILQEYKLLSSSIRILLESCRGKELKTLEELVINDLKSEALNVRICVVCIQFLARLTESKNVSSDVMTEVWCFLFDIAFSITNLNLKTFTNGTEPNEKSPNLRKSGELELVKIRIADALQSTLSKTFNQQFLESLFNHAVKCLVSVETAKEKVAELKSADEAVSKCDNVYLKAMLRSCCLFDVMESIRRFPDVRRQQAVEALQEICGSGSASPTEKIVNFITETTLREKQTSFDYEKLFRQLLIDNAIGVKEAKAIAKLVDVSVEVLGEGEEDSDEDDEDGDTESDDEEISSLSDNEAVTELNLANPSQKAVSPVPEVSNLRKRKTDDVTAEENSIKNKMAKLEKDENASDSDESLDMDAVPEEELERMDRALASVFATKRAMKEEEHTEPRSVLRSVSLLSMLTNRVKGKPQFKDIASVLHQPLKNCLKYATVSNDKILEVNVKFLLQLTSSIDNTKKSKISESEGGD